MKDSFGEELLSMQQGFGSVGIGGGSPLLVS